MFSWHSLLSKLMTTSEIRFIEFRLKTETLHSQYPGSATALVSDFYYNQHDMILVSWEIIFNSIPTKMIFLYNKTDESFSIYLISQPRLLFTAMARALLAFYTNLLFSTPSTFKCCNPQKANIIIKLHLQTRIQQSNFHGRTKSNFLQLLSSTLLSDELVEQWMKWEMKCFVCSQHSGLISTFIINIGPSVRSKTSAQL